jgi:hypothetical protein
MADEMLSGYVGEFAVVAEKHSPPPPPDGLGAAGTDVWLSLTTKFQFHAGELVDLEEAARTKDLIAAMDQRLDETGLLIPGSRGQLTLNPLVNQIAVHRGLLDRLLLSLALPADGEQVGRRRSPQARQAANSRWATEARRGRLPSTAAGA